MRTVILANGEGPTLYAVQRWLRTGDRLVCADGGARQALRLGLRPDVVIGDLDSLDEPAQAQLGAAGARFIVHPAAKDETDLELALLLAASESATEIVVMGALGGRLDQTIANVLLLTLPELTHVAVRLVDDALGTAFRTAPGATPGMMPRAVQEAFVIRGETIVRGMPGDTLSLIPLGGDAGGVSAEGVLYPLNDEVLHFGPARGVSNVLVGTTARVAVRHGLLLAILIRKEGYDE